MASTAMTEDITPRRGEIWYVNFSPTRGREQQGERPALVVSDDRFNESPAGLVIVLPLTTTERPGVPWHVEVSTDAAPGLERTSYIMCEQVRAVAEARLRRRAGTIEPDQLARVEDRLRVLMAL
jgi:mRNA interferase MazF